MRKIHIKSISRSRLRIKNRSALEWMVVIVAFWAVLFKPISVLPGVLSYLKYVPDGILLAMLILALGKDRILIKRDLLTPLRITVGFFCYCLLVYIFYYQSLAYFLWGFRNNFRFYIAFFVFVAYLNTDDVEAWFKTMDILFWVNAGLSVVQFFLMGIKGDFLGGIFGIQGGTNGYTLCLMSIIVCKSLLETFNGRESFGWSLAKCAVSIMVAAMAEMKFFFFVLIALMFGATVLTRFSVKKMIYLMLGMVAIMMGSVYLIQLFGSHGFFSLQSLWEYATKDNYSSYGDINRLSAIPTLSRTLVTNPLEQMFGLGLGNCDTSSFAICNTPFYRQYGYLHYTWFTSTMIFLEAGYIGLVIYASFFVLCFMRAHRNYKSGKGIQVYNQLTILIAVLCMILTVYNSSLRIESGYMMYFVLALPFIRQASEKKQEKTFQSETKGGNIL